MKGWIPILLLLVAAAPAAAQDAYPGESHHLSARFPDGATTVVVDVFEVGGSQVANNLATTRVQLDSLDTDHFVLNLATAGVTGYPTDCTRKTYVVRFVPDGANCSTGGDPSLCATTIRTVAGRLCGVAAEQPSYIFASTVLSAQGISQAVMDYYNRRGQLPIRWREVRRSQDLDFANVESRLWEVYFYSETLAWPHLKCVVPTASDPNVSLPSASSCTGN